MVEVAALVLAAGQASRYRAAGGDAPTKLVAPHGGKPLVRWAAEAALASRARPVVVVTGHARAEVEAALEGLEVQFVHNPEFADGLSTSLRTGLAALGPECAGALVLLGDMPDASVDVMDTMIGIFGQLKEVKAVVPVFNGIRGNPALLGRALFADAARLTGDEGARWLLLQLVPPELLVLTVHGGSVARDFDTPDDFGD